MAQTYKVQMFCLMSLKPSTRGMISGVLATELSPSKTRSNEPDNAPRGVSDVKIDIKPARYPGSSY